LILLEITTEYAKKKHPTKYAQNSQILIIFSHIAKFSIRIIYYHYRHRKDKKCKKNDRLDEHQVNAVSLGVCNENRQILAVENQ